MKVYHHVDELPMNRHYVVTFGSFDGVHRGHQKIFELMKERCLKGDKLETLVVTFDPHPRKIVYPNASDLKLLTTIDEKTAKIEKLGIKHFLIHPFTIEFSQYSPQEYVESFVLNKISPKVIVVGYDHRFGLNRQGDIAMLRSYEAEHGFEILEISEEMVDDSRVSSTIIRTALETNDITLANNLLGSPYSFVGKVIHGEKMGERLGFKTANLEVLSPDKLMPKSGIYAVQVSIEGAQFSGMLYIGTKPTFHRDSTFDNIEVHIFYMDQILYGKTLEVTILAYLRADQAFASKDELIEQLVRDKEASLEIIENL